MAERKSKEIRKAQPEPGPLMGFFAEQFYTFVMLAVFAAVLCGWNMLDTYNAGREIQPHMYVILVTSAAVLVLCGVVYVGQRDALEIVWRRGRALKETKLLLKESRRGRGRYAYRLNETQAADLTATEKALEEALEARQWERLGEALNQLDAKLDEHLSFARKSTAREYAESIGVAVLIALFLRSFVVEAFRIPSGSMIPTLQVGDHIFVNKFIYGVRIPFTDYKFGMGVRKPERGEVIVFKFPKDPDKDFIKRIVAVEGDTVEIRNNVVYINGQAVEHERVTSHPCEYDDKIDEESDHWQHRQCVAYNETLDQHRFTAIYNYGEGVRSWSPVKVPPGHVFVMGDNRDNSHDSRYWGFVPFELIKGKAMVVWWSSGQPEGIRIKRMGHLVE
ncbi:MAG TPA: signal peptidase I [Polyangia bacterium]|jgi:signal peptidase I|nr:signal peptidase I [Polyangia bacterium]